MKPFEYLKLIKALNLKIERIMFKEQEVPKELKLDHNKLMCDYNEAIKKNGKVI